MTHHLAALYKFCAIAFPTISGQGLIYLAISGEIDALSAVIAMAVLGALIVAIASSVHALDEERLARAYSPLRLKHSRRVRHPAGIARECGTFIRPDSRSGE